jgi:hypothetical protein
MIMLLIVVAFCTNGATALSVKTLCITTFSLLGLSVTFSMKGSQYNVMLSVALI